MPQYSGRKNGRGFSNRQLPAGSCLHIIRSNEKSSLLEPGTHGPFVESTPTISQDGRIVQTEVIICVFQLARNRVTKFFGAVMLTRSIAPSESRVLGGISNYSSSMWKVGREQGWESLGEMKINCLAGWVLSRPLAIWVRSEKWRTIKMHGVCYVVRHNRLYSLIISNT